MSSGRRGFSLIEVMIAVAIIGILAAIAIPAFNRFQARTKQAEAKTTLKAYFTAQRSYFAEFDKYSTRGDEISFSLEANNRYYYYFSSTCSMLWSRPGPSPASGFDCVTQDVTRYYGTLTRTAWSATLGPNTPTAPGVSGTCPACGFTAMAVGNLDPDTVLDQWHMTSTDGTSTAVGTCTPELEVSAGVPFNLINDVTCD